MVLKILSRFSLFSARNSLDAQFGSALFHGARGSPCVLQRIPSGIPQRNFGARALSSCRRCRAAHLANTKLREITYCEGIRIRHLMFVWASSCTTLFFPLLFYGGQFSELSGISATHAIVVFSFEYLLFRLVFVVLARLPGAT